MEYDSAPAGVRPWGGITSGVPPVVDDPRWSAIVDEVEHPAHYNVGKYEVLDVVLDWKLDFLLGNVVKYVARAAHKGNELVDLCKAREYLNRAIKERTQA
jgi:hypothetical protein